MSAIVYHEIWDIRGAVYPKKNFFFVSIETELSVCTQISENAVLKYQKTITLAYLINTNMILMKH